MFIRSLALAALPSFALFLGAVTPTQALGEPGCTVNCANGSSCDAFGSGATCRCNWLTGNAVCKGGSAISLSPVQSYSLVRTHRAAFSAGVESALGDKPQVFEIHGALFDASKALEEGDDKAFGEAMETLDTSVLTLDAEQQRTVKELALKLVGEE